MRVISGIRRGKKLTAPPGLDTRPTLDRVKQKMFDCIQFEVAGRTVLDLFAGSGQLGLEALSRGAEKCHFNDGSRSVCDIIRKNISECGFEKNAVVTCNLYNECVTMLKRSKNTFSLVLLDPPFHKGLIDQALTALLSADLLNEDAILVCEFASDEQITVPEGLSVWKSKKCGEVSFMVLQKEGA